MMLGSASHVVTSSSCTSSKPSSSKKRGRCSDLESNKPSHSSSSGPSMFWWRGGGLSRRVFNWKVLPHSLIHKAARQGSPLPVLRCFAWGMIRVYKLCLDFEFLQLGA